MCAAVQRVATVIGARVAVIATHDFALASAVAAAVALRASIAVVARRTHNLVLVIAFASAQIARAGRAGRARFTHFRCALDASADFTQVSDCTRVIVIAGNAVQIGRAAAIDRIAAVAGAGVVVIAADNFANTIAAFACIGLGTDRVVIAGQTILQRLGHAFAGDAITTHGATWIFAFAHHCLACGTGAAHAVILGCARIAVGIAQFAVVRGFCATRRRITRICRAWIAVVTDFARAGHATALFALVIVRAGILVGIARDVVQFVVLAALKRIATADVARTTSIAGRFIGQTITIVVFSIANFDVECRRRAGREPTLRTRAHTRALAHEFALVVFVFNKTASLRLLFGGQFTACAFPVLQFRRRGGLDALLDRRTLHRIYALTTIPCRAIPVATAGRAAKIALAGFVDASRVAVTHCLAIL